MTVSTVVLMNMNLKGQSADDIASIYKAIIEKYSKYSFDSIYICNGDAALQLFKNYISVSYLPASQIDVNQIHLRFVGTHFLLFPTNLRKKEKRINTLYNIDSLTCAIYSPNVNAEAQSYQYFTWPQFTKNGKNAIIFWGYSMSGGQTLVFKRKKHKWYLIDEFYCSHCRFCP